MVSNYKIAFPLILLTVLSLSAFLQSEDNGIFDDNFAKSPITDARKDELEQLPDFFEEATGPQNNSNGSGTDAKNKHLEHDNSFQDMLGETQDSNLVSVISVSFILNCLNTKHSTEQAKNLKAFTNKLGFTIYEVQCMGYNYTGLMGDRIFEFVPFYGGIVTYHASPLPPYENVKKSPTLIVETEQGDYIIEAPVKSFDTYFSSSGKLIISKLSQHSLTPGSQTFSDFNGDFFE